MNEELTTIFNTLELEVRRLNREWVIFQQLFSESDETVKLLGDTASTFFSIVWDLLIENIFLTICRLTDRERTLGKDNLTLKLFLTKIEDVNQDELTTELGTILNEIIDNSKSIRDWRNRKLSHSDFQTKIAPDDHPFEEIRYKDLGEIIELINNFMNTIRKKTNQSYTAYSSYIIEGGVEALVSFLRIGFVASEIEPDLHDLVFQLHKKLQELQ